jgi:hypothetical protein
LQRWKYCLHQIMCVVTGSNDSYPEVMGTAFVEVFF